MILDRDAWLAEGYCVVPGVLNAREVATIEAHYEEIRISENLSSGELTAQGTRIKNWRIVKPESLWPLAKETLLHPRIQECVERIFMEKALAVQSIFYYKPPNSPGQGLHWDNYYFEASPGCCVGVWLAIDKINEENGGLSLVPGSHKRQFHAIDESPDNGKRGGANASMLGGHALQLDSEASLAHPSVEPGDAIIFDGRIVHGSPPNKAKNRWRRSIACHYVPQSIEVISEWYLPLMDFEGAPVMRTAAESRRQREGNEWKAVTCNGWRSATPPSSKD